MSEDEKLRRLTYNLNRNKVITALSIATAVLFLCTLLFGLLYYRKTTTFYVTYTEKSNMDYSVKLKPNDFYTEDVLEDGMSYVVSLIDTIQAKIDYSLAIDKKDVEYSYNYTIETTTLIKEKNTKSVVLEESKKLYQSETKTVSSSNLLTISHPVDIEFTTYNDSVTNFINQLLLKDKVISELQITAKINIVGSCQEFINENAQTHQLSIVVPLATELSEIQITSNIPAYQEKSLACMSDDGLKNVLRTTTVLFLISTIMSLAGLIILIFLTRNDDINYAIKVKRIVSNYKSYIQKLLSEFDFKGYKVLKVASFKDLIEIRDTIQQPILMYENSDQTNSKFMVPTDSGIVYLYEVLVEKYASYYDCPYEEDAEQSTPVKENTKAEKHTPVEETTKVIKTEVIVKKTVEENPAEAAPIVIPDLPDDGDDDNDNGKPNGINYSFEAKLSLASDENRARYKEIVEFAQSYGVKVSNSWKKVRIFSKGKTYGVILFKGKTLCVAFPLEPLSPENEKYKFMDLSEFKKYAETPSVLKIVSDRKKSVAMQILKNMFIQDEIKNKNLKVTVELPENRTKEQLLAEGLIKL